MYNFQYWPPSSGAHDVCGGKPPNPPFAGASPLECSGYYYWWLFLRENADYITTCERDGSGPCSEMYRDFGDVRGDGFGRWWTYYGCELFCELSNCKVWDELTPNDCDKLQKRVRFERELVITVRYDAPLGSAMFEIQAALEQKLKRRTDQRNFSTALYPMFAKPVPKSLHQCYSAYKLRQSQPDMPLHEICVQAGLYTAGSTNDRKAAASIASRALKQAQLLIEHVGQGLFPIMTAAQLAKVPKFLADRERHSGQRRAQWEVERRKWHI